MFRASLCPSSGEYRPGVTAFGVLRWFCWMWLVAVVGRCVVGCEHCSHPTKNAIRQEIANVTQDTLRRVMASVPGRWQQCLDCHGGHLQDVLLKT